MSGIRTLGEESESKKERFEEVRTEKLSLLSVHSKSLALKSPSTAHSCLTSLIDHGTELGYTHNASQNCAPSSLAIRSVIAPKKPSQHSLP